MNLILYFKVKKSWYFSENLKLILMLAVFVAHPANATVAFGAGICPVVSTVDSFDFSQVRKVA